MFVFLVRFFCGIGDRVPLLCGSAKKSRERTDGHRGDDATFIAVSSTADYVSTESKKRRRRGFTFRFFFASCFPFPFRFSFLFSFVFVFGFVSFIFFLAVQIYFFYFFSLFVLTFSSVKKEPLLLSFFLSSLSLLLWILSRPFICLFLTFWISRFEGTASPKVCVLSCHQSTVFAIDRSANACPLLRPEREPSPLFFSFPLSFCIYFSFFFLLLSISIRVWFWLWFWFSFYIVLRKCPLYIINKLYIVGVYFLSFFLLFLPFFEPHFIAVFSIHNCFFVGF